MNLESFSGNYHGDKTRPFSDCRICDLLLFGVPTSMSKLTLRCCTEPTEKAGTARPCLSVAQQNMHTFSHLATMVPSWPSKSHIIPQSLYHQIKGGGERRQREGRSRDGGGEDGPWRILLLLPAKLTPLDGGRASSSSPFP